jgi:micrococcal nuclease
LSIILLTACSDIQTENATDTAPQTESTNNTNSKVTVQEDKGKTFTAKIVKVIDGDTVKIGLPNGNEETVRLLLIDTPETVHPSKPVQPFGPEASQFSKNLMPAGSEVEVETGISERDKYGRLLAYFYVNGKMVNKMLLEKGLARVAYVYAPNTKYLDEFEAIQKKAKDNAVGIWSIENYATSRGFDDTVTKESKQRESVTINQGCAKPTIKGNINSNGEKIYHISSGQYFQITKAEKMFCTEKDAQAAGFRKSER